MSMGLKSVAKRTLPLLLSLLAIELVLRLQQVIGPLYDLQMKDESYAGISQVLNHKPLPEETWELKDPRIFGDQAGYRYTIRHDGDGIRLNALRPDCPEGRQALRVLFLGDSFVEGYADSTTLVQHVWWALQKTHLRDQPMCLYNAGHSSYSPSIFIPQVKQLLPKLKPDYVVVVIDETDLGDDYLRYRDLIVRDAHGDIVAVRASPPAVKLVSGLLKARRHKLYLMRFLHKIYHTRIFMPAFRHGYGSWRPYWILHPSQDRGPDVADKYRTEISFFEDNLRELVRTLQSLMPDCGGILFVCHPHLHHLQPGADGFLWNHLTMDAVERVTRESGIDYYNAIDDMRSAFAGHPEDFYWHQEMHFNFAGFTVYGRLLANELLPRLESVLLCRQSGGRF